VTQVFQANNNIVGEKKDNFCRGLFRSEGERERERKGRREETII
jgi:hypothetical protein